MRAPTRNAEAGFSLIETVVALAIVALSLGTVYQIIDVSAKSVSKTDNYLQALGAAQSKLAEAAAQPVLQPGTTLGTMNGVAWSRTVKASARPQPTPETRLFDVTVVATREGSRVELTTVLIASAARD